MHLQPAAPGLPCCWDITVHLLGSSTCNPKVQGTEVIRTNVQSWEKGAGIEILLHSILNRLTWEVIYAASPPQDRAISQIRQSWCQRMVSSVTRLCIVGEKIVGIHKIQKVMVRVIGLFIIFHFPNFLKYGFTNLKMNATHTQITHTPNPKTHSISLFSNVAKFLCAMCWRVSPVCTLISSVITIISFPVNVMKPD